MRVWFVYVPQAWEGHPDGPFAGAALDVNGTRGSAARTILYDLRAEALRTFGGLTIWPVVEGYWKTDSGHVCLDHNAPWEIATDDEESIMRFAESVRCATNQIAVYVRKAGTASIITKGS